MLSKHLLVCILVTAESGLVGMIVGMCCGRLGWHAGAWRYCAWEGVVRLLGGGLNQR